MRFTHITFSYGALGTAQRSLLFTDVTGLGRGPEVAFPSRAQCGSDHNYREGAGRCSSRRARPPGRRPWGPRARAAGGAATAVVSHPGTAPPRGRPGAGPRGGRRGRGARVGRRRAVAPAARAPRAERSRSSCERLEQARLAQSGSSRTGAPCRRPHRHPSARSPRRRLVAADGVHLSGERAGRRAASGRGPEPSQPWRFRLSARELRPGVAAGPRADPPGAPNAAAPPAPRAGRSTPNKDSRSVSSSAATAVAAAGPGPVGPRGG